MCLALENNMWDRQVQTGGHYQYPQKHCQTTLVWWHHTILQNKVHEMDISTKIYNHLCILSFRKLVAYQRIQITGNR